MLQQSSPSLWHRFFLIILIFSLPSIATANQWATVDRLIHDQKYQSAQKESDTLLSAFKQQQDIPNWTKALIQSTELRVAQGQWETATEYLQKQQWPEDANAQSILNLYMANTFNAYLSNYSWEIQQREQIESKDTLDLKTMTQAQLVDAINHYFNEAYKQTLSLGSSPIPDTLNAYFIPGKYPERIRGTLRDTVSYLWADFLKNEAYWSASHSNQTYRLDLQTLLGNQHADTSLENSAQHPLSRYVRLLSDLENWHQQAQRSEAALEAYRTRLIQLSSHFSSNAKLMLIIKALEQRIAQTRQLPWSTMAQWTLATLQQQLTRQDAWILAHATTVDCQQHFPESQGTKHCKQLFNILSAPEFSTEAMRLDGLKKRAIRIQHKNIDRLYFRAYPAALLPVRNQAMDQQIATLLKEKPRYAWSENLPKTKDFRYHYSYSTPLIDQFGKWLILSSADNSFVDTAPIQLTEFQTSRLVASTQILNNTFEVTVYEGETGKLVSGATVELWKRDYQDTDKKITSTVTDSTGMVVISPNSDNNFFLKIHKNNDHIELDNLYHYLEHETQERAQSLIFTDRSIYRPKQSIQWKVVAYQGLAHKENLTLLKNNAGWVRLRDSNGQIVAEEKVVTNNYGSASGAFLIPAGKKLGSWSINSSWSGYSGVKVEEYKRPTFTVAFEDNNESMRLNQAARLTGKAEYYFGGAVSNGKVAWRVTRQPVYDWRYRRFGRPQNTSTEIVATGESRVDKEGRFAVNFLPKAKEIEGDDGVSYRFELSADVTDEGGETRSANRTFRLGSIAIAASLETAEAFTFVGQALSVNATRYDLDQVPRAGKATWRLHKLVEPSQPQLPADIPVHLPAKKRSFASEGDSQAPRWENHKNIDTYVESWPETAALRQGSLDHAQDGTADITLKNLQTGIYRLHYQTHDRWGKPYKTHKNLVIANQDITQIALPILLKTQLNETTAGNSIELLVGTGLQNTPVKLEVFHRNERLQQTILKPGIQRLSFPVSKAYRGGLSFVATALADYQYLSQQQFVSVPWDNKNLQLSFSSFRDKLRPGAKETWRITVKDHHGNALSKDAIELLASMYDKSLDFFTPHAIPSLATLFNQVPFYQNTRHNLGLAQSAWNRIKYQQRLTSPSNLQATLLKTFHANNPGRMMARGGMVMMEMAAAPAPMMQKSAPEADDIQVAPSIVIGASEPAASEDNNLVTQSPFSVRTNFNETAFFYPHLVTDENGEVSLEFEVPESLTEWKVWVSAIGHSLEHGQLQEQVNTSKELMVRPYLPRFLREGDRAEIQVSVNNTSDTALTGQLAFEIYDPLSGESLAEAFALDQSTQDFAVAAKESSTLTFRLHTPDSPGMVGIRAKASTATFSDGEQHPLPILPSRINLAQSRFIALTDQNTKTLHFEELANDTDDTRINQQLVVTVDGQLFYSVLNALPYLVDYPYECTEQTLNRFLSTAIVNNVFNEHPSIAAMAEQLATRKTQLPSWNQEDPNRKLQLEETPWLVAAAGGDTTSDRLLRILDPKIAAQQQALALEKLQKMQTSSGGFPWWEGGPPSPYMTAYLLQGFSRALEFSVDIPKQPIQRAWQYLHQEYGDQLKDDQHLHSLTFINYILSAYPDSSWTNNLFSEQARKSMMDLSFKHWRELSPLLKSYLALTLNRAGRSEDALLVFESIMDNAKHDEQLGTYWAPEDRSWLWYNDTVDTHAFLLRALAELRPNDDRRKGMVQWLMLDKKLSHWKSTRATAESIYALTHYLKQDDLLGNAETLHLTIGNQASKTMTFTPDNYTGNNQQTVIDGDKISPDMANITLKKDTENLMFASATWHFSTEKLPTAAQGDFFTVNRKLFKRVQQNKQWVLKPLQEGAIIKVGDLLEVQLSLRTKHAAEYVHLRAPRAAGFEPDSQTSGYRWQTGIGYFEEVRDSGINYFFERLPQGEYGFKYRVRATTAGAYRMAPAQIQSMYAPEFTAYSSGSKIQIQKTD